MTPIEREFNETADTIRRTEIEGDEVHSFHVSDEAALMLMICKRLDKIADNLEYIAQSAENMAK